MTLPFVFVLDLDGTIVGRVDFQSQQYILYSTLRQSGFKVAKQYTIPPAYFPNARLVRPGLASFMKEIYTLYGQQAYFFVYTASEKSWAMQQIAWIEKTHGVKFMRPLFTRDDCIVSPGGNMRKSLTKIWPRICRALPAMSPKDRTHILEHQTLIIDNNPVFVDHTDKLLLCPTYDYMFFENMLHGIPAEARKHPNVDRLILGFINEGLLCPHVETSRNQKEVDGMRQLAKQYNWLAGKCAKISEENQQHIKDHFWSILRKLLVGNGVNHYTPSVILQLQNTVWKTMKRAYA